jgi:hypothetical protein
MMMLMHVIYCVVRSDGDVLSYNNFGNKVVRVSNNVVCGASSRGTAILNVDICLELTRLSTSDHNNVVSIVRIEEFV